MRVVRTIAPIVLCLAAAIGCGEDGQGFGPSDCPVLPLFHFKQTGTTTTPTYVEVGPDGGALSASAKAALAQAETSHCLTPAGAATSLGEGAGGAPSAGGGSSVGGTSSSASLGN
ncbi:MAG TPA: hypothetical protein VH142_24270 [Polyangiaceae bacterium]|jgi:hypothetical protein|nr:hypothetical protein [Polyangiaceae bacterium]